MLKTVKKHKKTTAKFVVITLYLILIVSCSKIEQTVTENSKNDINKKNIENLNIEYLIYNILKENNIDDKIVEYKQINNVEELSKKYPVLYEGLSNGIYEVKTEGFRLMVDVKEKKILKTFNEVSVRLG